MLNAFEKRDIKGVDNCLANKLDPNHVFYENGETTTVLNLAIAAGEEFFDHVMKYNPVTRRVVKESPLEVAIKYNVDFLYKVLEIVDPDDENDARIVKNLKYMLPNDAPFEKVKSAEKNTIRSPISNEFYVSLSSRKVLVFANQHKEFFLDDPDEFEASDHGFYNVPNIAKYLFTGVDTIIVDEKQSNDKETLAMICESFTAETERKIFVVQNDSKRLGVFSKYEPQRIYLTSSKRYP